MKNKPSPLISLSERNNREREFHDSLILSGNATIATKEWWETPGGKVRFDRRISMLRGACTGTSRRLQILIIGCGDGDWVNAVSEFADVTGVDISPEIVKSANQRLDASHNTRVEIGDVHKLRFGDSSFDVCFANSVLHHLDLPIALAEIHRVLRSGGRLVAGEPNRRNPQVWWMYRSPKNRPRYGLTPDEEAFTRTQIKALLQQHFTDVSVSCFDFWHPRFGRASEQSFLLRLTLVMERLPLIKQIGGSLWISATKPRS